MDAAGADLAIQLDSSPIDATNSADTSSITDTSSVADTSSTTDVGVADVGVETATPLPVVISVGKAGTGTGTVTSNLGGIACGATCMASYAPTTTVILTATPAIGSTFAGWTGGPCTGTGTCMITVAAATMVTASFTLNQYLLGVTKTGNGTGTVTSPSGINCGATCSQTLSHGTSVTLTAAPGTGSMFAGWTGGGCTGTATCTVPMTAATSVTAEFALLQFALTVTKPGTGTGTVTGTGLSCGATCTVMYNYGASVTLSATAGAGSLFVGWSGAVCTGTGTCIVSMTAPRSVGATFSKALTCTTTTVSYCQDGAFPETNLGTGLTTAACHDQCAIGLAAKGYTAGCWVLAINGNCYCRTGAIGLGTAATGGSCTN